MKTRNWLVPTACTCLLLAGCKTVPTQEDQGVLVGAIIGGIVGHQVGGGSGRTLATIVGTMAGAAIGGSVGRSMDERDRLTAAHALETVRTDVATQWVNPDSGHEYVITPTRTYDGSAGPCREYTLDAQIGGKTEQVFGTACRQQDGSWEIVN